MFRDMLNFKGINWWTMVGGLGTFFISSMGLSLLGTYFATTSGENGWYPQFGAPLMVLLAFVIGGLAGWLIAKIADDEPMKHAMFSSLGAVVPLIAAAVMTINVVPFMMAAVMFAGSLNGAMLSMRRRHRL